MIKQQDAVGLTLFDDKIRDYVPPRSKNNHLKVLLSKLDNKKKDKKGLTDKQKGYTYFNLQKYLSQEFL